MNGVWENGSSRRENHLQGCVKSGGERKKSIIFPFRFRYVVRDMLAFCFSCSSEAREIFGSNDKNIKTVRNRIRFTYRSEFPVPWCLGHFSRFTQLSTWPCWDLKVVLGFARLAEPRSCLFRIDGWFASGHVEASTWLRWLCLCSIR